LNVKKLSVSASRAPPDSLTSGFASELRYVLLLHTTTEYNGRHLAHTKNYCPLCSGSCFLVASSASDL